jgi:3-(3-hydroxy-phenyl)propionate hydroxylase
MRPAGRGPLESLYFTYPSFPAAPFDAAREAKSRHPVLIVGAGPIGMTAALTLARYGVKSIVLDNKATFNDGSRAICIARSSMQILERIGAVEPFLGKSLGWRHGTSYFRGHPIYRLDMPHSDHDKYLPMYNLQQQYIEQFLYDAISTNPLIEVRWQHEAMGLEPNADGATLAVTTPNGAYSITGDYVLAADGARSRVRSLMNLRLSGDNYEGRYVIADVQMAHDYPTERRAFFEPAWHAGGTVLIHKQPHNIWRIDYQLEDGEDAVKAVREDTIRARVSSIIAGIGHTGGWNLEWWSVYTANTLCLDDYKHGRVIFIGDSAHIVPIFGVRGLNNGLADAHNIGWKLGYVLNGHADASLLDSYTPERRGATLDVFANATKSTRFMTPPTRGLALMREAALSLAIQHPFARPFANPRQMQPYTYAASPVTLTGTVVDSFSAGPAPGAACPNVRLAGDRYLLDQLGHNFSALVFTDDATEASTRDLLAALRALDPGFTVLPIRLDGAVPDLGSTVASVYGASSGTIYLIRPDLHVAGRWQNPGATTVINALRHCLGYAVS